METKEPFSYLQEPDSGPYILVAVHRALFILLKDPFYYYHPKLVLILFIYLYLFVIIIIQKP
jgi:hypothetical protein